MTLKEIIAKCEANLANGDLQILLLIPGKWGKKKRARSWKGGPLGKIIAEPEQGKIIVSFGCKEILDSIEEALK